MSNLNLSIDAGGAYDEWVSTPTYKEELLWVLDSYDAIVQPLHELAGLKNIHIYWPAFHDLEAKAERQIMGNYYDSYRHGKSKLVERHPFNPRGKGLVPDIYLGKMDDQD